MGRLMVRTIEFDRLNCGVQVRPALPPNAVVEGLAFFPGTLRRGSLENACRLCGSAPSPGGRFRAARPLPRRDTARSGGIFVMAGVAAISLPHECHGSDPTPNCDGSLLNELESPAAGRARCHGDAVRGLPRRRSVPCAIPSIGRHGSRRRRRPVDEIAAAACRPAAAQSCSRTCRGPWPTARPA